MGISPGHKFGQIIGEALEKGVLPILKAIASRNNLFLDMKGSRPARDGVKCTWIDLNKNKHDLDYVLERGGSPERVGAPVAFIETAWRRYTKHSKNKVQEIQGAVLPLVATFRHSGPLYAAILAGEFTGNSLAQLRSLGFLIVHIPFDSIVKVFGDFGVDAHYGEETSDAEFRNRIKSYKRLNPTQRKMLGQSLISPDDPEIRSFIAEIEKVASRQIDRVLILPLFGSKLEAATVDEAINLLSAFDEGISSGKIDRYEIQVRYNNGNVIEGRFNDRAGAIEFLRSYRPEIAL